MKLNKPKFWDQQRPNLISYLLIPFTIIFKINNLIIKNYKKLKPKEIKSICIGNIYIGGTGKTPLTIKLYNIISKFNKNTVVIKKYYTAHSDEITLLKKYTNLIFGKERKQLIIDAIKKKYQVAIFDDGLQEKKIDYNLKFVCFDASKWIGNAQLLPAGPLRQDINVLKSIDAVFLKYIKNINKKAIIKIKSINQKIKIFNFTLKIQNKNEYDLSKKYVIISGIGNSDSFIDLLQKNNFKIEKNIKFPDHYEYEENEIKNIISKAKFLKTKILTTEKDYVRLPKKYLYKFGCIKTDIVFKERDKLLKFLKVRINE